MYTRMQSKESQIRIAEKKLLLYLTLFLALDGGPVAQNMVPKNQDNIRVCMESCYPHDCSDIFNNQELIYDGVYIIYPSGRNSPGVPVYCDMTSKGGPWTVFQKRFDGSVDFYRGWNAYVTGFGRADGEYWLGLKNIHLLLQKKQYSLRIDLEDVTEKRFVTYDKFFISPLAISPEEDRYKLHIDGFQEGDIQRPAGNALRSQNGMNFSTYDRDGDTHRFNCAEIFKGASWYADCHSCNLNGKYLNGSTEEYATSMVWSTWKGFKYSLMGTQMKIAPHE
ncbi:microfibril-associated glycoprotein 4-like isoform 1-T1 [Discoglossus pictus]